MSSQHKKSLNFIPSILFSFSGFCRSSWHFTCNLPPRRVRVPHACRGLIALPPALVSTSSTTATDLDVWRLKFSVPLVSSSPGKGLVASQVRCTKSKWLFIIRLSSATKSELSRASDPSSENGIRLEPVLGRSARLGWLNHFRTEKEIGTGHDMILR